MGNPRKALIVLFVLLLGGCRVDPVACKNAAELTALASAEKLCPPDLSPWDECPSAPEITKGLEAALLACDAQAGLR